MRKFSWWALCLLCLISVPLALAQGNPQRTVINYTTVEESGDQQLLRLFFTVLDTEGQAVVNPEIDNVNIVLDNGAPVEVLEVTTPDIPLNIVLVLDTSGSMGAASADMQRAATEAVNNAPQNTRFAVISFNQQITTQQNFTDSRQAVIDAIGRSQSVPNSGTCLYDATFTALEQLNTVPEPARRAVILFTDGRDEITLGRGDQCSQHSFSEVIDLALESPQQIPIYTIGLRGDRSINETELRSFATSTGGLSQIGEQAALPELFRQIINSLSGQRLVQADLCSESGSRTATLIVTTGGQRLQADVTEFELETSCEVATVVPTQPSPTPRPLTLFIESFSVNLGTNTMRFEVRRSGDISASQLRIQVADGETGAIQEERVIEVGSTNTQVIELPVGNLTGDIEIIVSALDENGDVISRQNAEFGVTRPTATPTPRPAQVFIESFSVNIPEETMRFEVRRTGDEPVTQLRVLVNNGQTGALQLERIIEVDAATEIIELPTSDLGGGDIEIVVQALDANGNVVARVADEFGILRPTATPTATAIPVSLTIDSVEFDPNSKVLTLNVTPRGAERIEDFRLVIVNRDTNLLQGTYSPTLQNRIELELPTLEPGEYIARALVESNTGERLEVESVFQYILLVTPTPVISATIRTVDIDAASQEFILRIDTQNETEIDAYRVRVVNNESGLLVNEFTTFSLPPYDEVRLSHADLNAGTYEITVFALNANEQPIMSSSVEIDWTPPPTPTPTPEPGFVEQTTTRLRENPPLAIGVVIVVLALVVLLFFLLRGRGRREENWGGVLPSAGETGVFVAPKASAPGGAASPKDDDRTQIINSGMAKTPGASLYVMEASAGTGLQGQRFDVTGQFSIGRSGSNMNFVNDKTVSRSHAVITYDGGHFTITDQGSGNGTYVDDKKLEAGQKATLRDGSIIKIGPNNQLRFEMDNDKTQVF